MIKLLLPLLLTALLMAEDAYYRQNLPSTEPPTVNIYTPPPEDSDKGYYPTQTVPDNSKMYDYRAPTYDIYNYDKAPVE